MYSFQQKLILFLIMFTYDTFLSSLDRLSIKSTITGRTGTILGILGSIAFIVVSFVLFIGPVVTYFEGDYIQGIYQANQQEPLQFYSGCDFKLGLFFYSKSNNQLIDHTSIQDIFDIKITYTTGGQTTLADVLPCSSDYFSQMNQTQSYSAKDCFIIPNQLEISSTAIQINIFGFNLLPVCDDPFMCTGNSLPTVQNSIDQFLVNHYYVLRFTAKNIDHSGRATMKFYQISSTQWAGEQTIIPNLYVMLEKQKMQLDNSIMPWWNNITLDYIGWLGLIKGQNPIMDTISIAGTDAMIATSDSKQIYFRYYKKLDWLLGMLGGGIFLIFIFFQIPCHTFAVIKQKVQQCQSIAIVQEEDKISKPKFRSLWYLTNLLPFNLNYCFQKQRRIMQECQKFTDIAELIKKMKIAVRNTETNEKIKFQCRILSIKQNQKKGFSKQQLKYQLSKDTLQKFVDQPDIPKIYDNNLSMLTLYYDLQQREDRSQVGQILRNVLQSQIYSKIKIPDFKKGKKANCCDDICNSFFSFIKNIIKWFDVFGAKPNLSAYPHHSSGVGCLFCLLICILSCLTFALTLANMGVTRTFWDQVYIPPQQQNITTTTGKQFKSLLCFTYIPIQYNLVVSPSRHVDIKFYQYKRSKKQESYQYIQTILASTDGNTYFNTEQQSNTIDLGNCFKPVDNINLQVYGNSNSDQQAYVGYLITPYCRGTDQYCSTPSVINTINANFYSLINVHPMWVYLPHNVYYSDQKQILTTPYRVYFSQIVNYVDLNFNQPMEQHMFMDTLEFVNDRSNWVTGNASDNITTYLSVDEISGKSQFTTYTSSGKAFYRLKLSTSGKVQRIIFSNYKIDFLFAIIGGSFVFYFFFLGCIGKLYTNFQIRAKLAQLLYDEDQKEISWIGYLLSWARIYCCQDIVIKRIQDDIDCIQLCKKVDTVYRLSCTKFNKKIQKDLSLIYMKQLIKQSQQVTLNPYEQQKEKDEEEENDNFQRDLEQANRNRRGVTRNAVANDHGQDQHRDYSSQNESNGSGQVNNNYEDCQPQKPTIRQNQRFGKFINSFDIFHANSQFTLNGQRQVRSICGGLCCLMQLGFIIILTLHFLFLYSSDFHQVSLQKIVDQDSALRSMNFEGGKNYKFAVSFIKYDDFTVKNVSSLFNGNVGISLIKYKSEKINGVNVQSQIGNIPLKNCDSNYFNDFLDSRDSQQYYKNFDKAYCVPDGTLLNLNGSTNDQSRQFFSLKLYNKGSTGLTNINLLLSSYIPRFHISNPIVDYRKDGYIRYRMDQFMKFSPYLSGYSYKFNLTVTKNIIKYDTAVNPTNQKLSLDSYQFTTPDSKQFAHQFSTTGNVTYQLLFYPEDLYNQYTIKTIKINQLFGLIGGCIVFIFFGIGWIPRSFNQFKMRYMIGQKLYTILGRKKVPTQRKRKGKKQQVAEYQVDQYSQYSQLGLVGAWILSFWGFIQRNFNTNNTLRHYSLIQSRVSNDINLFKFMKNLHLCQDAIKRKKLVANSDLNLCKVHPKNIIYISRESQQQENNLIDKILNNHQQLIAAATMNGFTIWELNKIVQAKQNDVQISNIFKEKWLDDYFKVTRKPTQNSQSQLFSRTSSFRGMMSQIDSKRSQRRSQIKSERGYRGSEKKSMIRQKSQIDKKEMKQEESKQNLNQQYQQQQFQNVDRPVTSKSNKGGNDLPFQFEQYDV